MKSKIKGICFICMVYMISSKIGKEIWNARIECNKKVFKLK